MLTKIIKQLNILQWPFNFSFKKIKASSSKIACLEIGSQEISIVGINKASLQKELLFNATTEYKNSAQLKKILDQWVMRYQLAEMPITWMLQMKDYRLLVIDDLLVEPQEFQSAIRLKIKNLIDFPVEDALIDSFQIPSIKSDILQKKIMVVVARISYIQPILDLLQESNINITVITIPEIGLKNISTLYENDQGSNLLIYLTDESSHLLITAQKNLYLSRKIEINRALLQPHIEIENTALNQFILEIQRSFDYYQSAWRKGAISQILLSSTWEYSEKMVDKLSTQLNIVVKPVQLMNFLLMNQDLSLVEQAVYLPLIGGILKEEEKNYATTN